MQSCHFEIVNVKGQIGILLQKTKGVFVAFFDESEKLHTVVKVVGLFDKSFVCYDLFQT